MLQSLKQHVCENGHYHIFKTNVETCNSYLQFSKWKYFTLDELDEVLACMQDSDRNWQDRGSFSEFSASQKSAHFQPASNFFPNTKTNPAVIAQKIKSHASPNPQFHNSFRPKISANEPKTFEPNNCLISPFPCDQTKTNPNNNHNTIKIWVKPERSIVARITNHVRVFAIILERLTYHFSIKRPIHIVTNAIRTSPCIGVRVGNC